MLSIFKVSKVLYVADELVVKRVTYSFYTQKFCMSGIQLYGTL